MTIPEFVIIAFNRKDPSGLVVPVAPPAPKTIAHAAATSSNPKRTGNRIMRALRLIMAAIPPALDETDLS
jgi:hypothetical protein